MNYDEKSESFIFPCPHCMHIIQVPKSGINCKIFRHAVYKSNLQQIPPHSAKKTCDKLLAEGKVFGCAKPFIFDGVTALQTNEYN